MVMLLLILEVLSVIQCKGVLLLLARARERKKKEVFVSGVRVCVQWQKKSQQKNRMGRMIEFLIAERECVLCYPGWGRVCVCNFRGGDDLELWCVRKLESRLFVAQRERRK